MAETEMTLEQQIEKALDGRTQRWLSFEVRIPEAELSKKINGKMEFTQQEINRINERLSCNIILPEPSTELK